MRGRKSKEVNIFSASVVDLFASGLGVFLIVSIIALSKQSKSTSKSEKELIESVQKIKDKYAEKFKIDKKETDEMIKEVLHSKLRAPTKFENEISKIKLNQEIRKLKFELQKTQNILEEVQSALKSVEEKGQFELRVGQRSKLENVHFYPGTSQMIEPYASREIKKISWHLKQKRTMKIEVSGHIYQSKRSIQKKRDRDTGNISKKRAKVVCKKLISFGVKASQLTCKGYGAKRSLHLTNDSLSIEAQLNRRVEIEVLSQ